MERGEQEQEQKRERKGEVVGLSIMDRCQAMFCSMGDDVEPFFLLLLAPFEFCSPLRNPR